MKCKGNTKPVTVKAYLTLKEVAKINILYSVYFYLKSKRGY